VFTNRYGQTNDRIPTGKRILRVCVPPLSQPFQIFLLHAVGVQTHQPTGKPDEHKCCWN
jgi:hypothetical protein